MKCFGEERAFLAGELPATQCDVCGKFTDIDTCSHCEHNMCRACSAVVTIELPAYDTTEAMTLRGCMCDPCAHQFALDRGFKIVK